MVRSTLTHPARAHLEALGRRIPELWSIVDQVRTANEDEIGGVDWPPHCYLPLEHAAVVAADVMRARGEELTRMAAARNASIIATLAAWRMTQGIYRYDPTLYAALVESTIEGELPAGVIQHLPEWCVYIETPEMRIATTRGDVPLRGTFAWLDRTRGQRHDTLTLLLDAEGMDLTISHLPLIGTMKEAIASVAEEWRSAHARGNTTNLPPEHFETEAHRTLTPIISLVLYLCTKASDISGRQGAPKNPEPIRTRRHGVRLFAAHGQTTWDVGVRMGAALRQAREKLNQTATDSSGRIVLPYVRIAHWHTYVFGPRDRPPLQRRVPRWLPPIPVLISDYDDLPAVIRGVNL